MLKNKYIKIIFKAIKISATLLLSLMLIGTILQRIFPIESSFLKYRTFVIVTKSMEPELKVGDIILVNKVKPEKIKVGDSITYNGLSGAIANKIITHKVEKIKEEAGRMVFTTKGLANLSADAYFVYPEQIYGKVTYRFKLLSFVSRLIKTWYGFMLIIVIPLTTLFVSEMFQMKKEIKERLD